MGIPYERKVELLKIFNELNHDSPWSEDYRKEFIANYKALAVSMTKPIIEAIDNSEIRKSIKVIKLKPRETIKVKPNTPFFMGLGNWNDYFLAIEDGNLRYTPLAVETRWKLGEVTPENIEKGIRFIVKGIIEQERQAINMFKEALDVDDIVLYVKKDFEPIDDPTLIKQQKIGVFGWEEISITTEEGEILG